MPSGPAPSPPPGRKPQAREVGGAAQATSWHPHGPSRPVLVASCWAHPPGRGLLRTQSPCLRGFSDPCQELEGGQKGPGPWFPRPAKLPAPLAHKQHAGSVLGHFKDTSSWSPHRSPGGGTFVPSTNDTQGQGSVSYPRPRPTSRGHEGPSHGCSLPPAPQGPF